MWWKCIYKAFSLLNGESIKPYNYFVRKLDLRHMSFCLYMYPAGKSISRDQISSCIQILQSGVLIKKKLIIKYTFWIVVMGLVL